MSCPRSAAFLRTVARSLERAANRLDPHPYADFVEKLRLEREREIEREIAAQSPDPASPGDVWQRGRVEHITAYGRAIRKAKR